MPPLILTLVASLAAPSAATTTVWATPHDSYSSSVGVLGCKINTNRVAYWPGSVDCNNICIKLSNAGRSVKLLRIDQSGGAHDVSYDAWNYLYTGFAATDKPAAGGAVPMEYEDLDASECAELIHTKDGRLPFSAANSMNFVASCLAVEGSWVGKNYAMWNIMDSVCSLGFDEECKLDLSVSNQPNCTHTLGLPVKLTSQPVYNIRYPTGQVVDASSGVVAPPSATTPLTIPGQQPGGTSGAKGGLSAGAKAGIGIGVTLGVLAIVAAAFFLWRRRQRSQLVKRPQDAAEQGQSDGVSISDREEEVTEKGISFVKMVTLKETK